MAKIRLNAAIRQDLNNLVVQRIRYTGDDKLHAKLRDTAERALMKRIKQLYPPKHMAILKKYDCVTIDRNIPIIAVYKPGQFPGLRTNEMHYRLDEKRWPQSLIPLRPVMHYSYREKCVRLEEDTPEAEAWGMFQLAEMKVNQKTADMRAPLFALIKAASSIEEVEEAWPDAHLARPLKANVPSIHIGTLQDQVRAALGR